MQALDRVPRAFHPVGGFLQGQSFLPEEAQDLPLLGREGGQCLARPLLHLLPDRGRARRGLPPRRGRRGRAVGQRHLGTDAALGRSVPASLGDGAVRGDLRQPVPEGTLAPILELRRGAGARRDGPPASHPRRRPADRVPAPRIVRPAAGCGPRSARRARETPSHRRHARRREGWRRSRVPGSRCPPRARRRPRKAKAYAADGGLCTGPVVRVRAGPTPPPRWSPRAAASTRRPHLPRRRRGGTSRRSAP